MVVVCGMGVFLPDVSPADEAEERREQAQKLFVKGNEALDKGDVVSGCALMRESLERFAVPNSLFKVAQCNEGEGKLLAAREHWERGLSLLDAPDKRVPFVKQSLEAVTARIPRLRIIVPVNQPAAEVSLNGTTLAADRLNALIEVDPGKQVVVVKREGHEDNRVEVVLKEKERTEVTAALGPKRSGGVGPVPTVSNTAPPPPPPPPASGLRVGGFVALGVGVAGAIGAGVTGGLIVSHDGDVLDECRTRTCSDKTSEDAKNSVRSLLPVNAAMWGVGIAGVGAGVVLLVLASKNSTAPKDQAPAALVVPMPVNGGSGVSVIGRF